MIIGSNQLLPFLPDRGGFVDACLHLSSCR